MELLHYMSRKLKVSIKLLFRNSFCSATPQPRHQYFEDDNQAFMSCIIKVNPEKRGWHNGVLSVLRNCKGVRTFEIDEDGSVKISGIGDPHILLYKIARRSKAKLVWFQFGQCSKKLFLPEIKKPAKEEPVDEKNNNEYGYGYYPPLQDGYGYGYPPAVQDGYGYYYPPAIQGYAYPPVSNGSYPYATQYPPLIFH